MLRPERCATALQLTVNDAVGHDGNQLWQQRQHRAVDAVELHRSAQLRALQQQRGEAWPRLDDAQRGGLLLAAALHSCCCVLILVSCSAGAAEQGL
jgi:hypothetical protein